VKIKVGDFFQQLQKTDMQVNAGWCVFNIVIEHPVIDGDENKCFAHVDFETHTLTIDGTLTEECARQSFLHEVWHILWEAVGYGQVSIDDSTIKLNNEHLTESATKAIILFFKLNSDIWHLLWSSSPHQPPEALNVF
jgi:hypothetical protein